MSLIKCSECGHEISDKAEYCVNCGCPIKNEQYNVRKFYEEFTTCPICKTRYEKPVDTCDKCKFTIYLKTKINKDIPKCPTCGSTKIEKISMARKAVGGAMFGLFSSDVRNSMRCRNCGYKF